MTFLAGQNFKLKSFKAAKGELSCSRQKEEMLYALQGSSRLGAKLGMHAKKYSFCYSMRDRSQEDPTLLLYMEQQRGEILKTSQKKSYTSSP